MDNEELLRAVEKGLIPGPLEDEESYRQRVDVGSGSPVRFMGFDLSWCKVVVEKKGLHFWEAGASWICDEPYVQIHPKRQSDEVLHHELIHILRSRFSEEIFEEFLAHRSSKRAWRRYFGPLLQGSQDVAWLAGAAMLGIGLDVWQESLFFSTLVYGFVFLGLFARLWSRQNVLERTMRKIAKIFAGMAPLQVMVFLTDQEIQEFAIWECREIQNYLKRQALSSLRIRALLLLARKRYEVRFTKSLDFLSDSGASSVCV